MIDYANTKQMNKNSGQASPILITIIAIIVITAGLFLSKYNQLQTLDEATDAAWSQVLNTYKRRADLVPQVVEVVKSYTQHEKNCLPK